MTTTESQIEQDFIARLKFLKYDYRPEIRDRASLEANFRKHFQELNRVRLCDSEFGRLKDDLLTADVFSASKCLREINSFERDDGTPLFYSLVNIKDWCKNTYEVVNQLRINTDNSGEFDLDYQDVQKRIKDQQYSNEDLRKADPQDKYEHKIDIIIIVVDILLTGFDSKYLNTLYVNKNLKYHGLIQGFSRTNRILNDSKPYGNVLDFRSQKDAVDEAIKLFSGKQGECAREIWLVDAAPQVIAQFDEAVTQLDRFMASQGLANTPDQEDNLKGDEARAAFINLFKDVQRLKTKLDQYTDRTEVDQANIAAVMPEDQLKAFRGAYLETAWQLKKQQDSGTQDDNSVVQQHDFEFVLFASAVIDYDYIMALINNYQGAPEQQKMSRDELIGVIAANAKFIDERDDISAYIHTLKAGDGLSEKTIRDGYLAFKAEQKSRQLAPSPIATGWRCMPSKPSWITSWPA